MGINYFTDEQVKELEKNSYVKSVTNKYVNYTQEFKEYFYLEYAKGIPANRILENCGFNLKALGKSRVKSLTDRVRMESRRSDGFTDTRKDHSGRCNTKKLTTEQKLERAEQKIKILSQENDFLKRVRFINKKQILDQSKIKPQSKNTN